MPTQDPGRLLDRLQGAIESKEFDAIAGLVTQLEESATTLRDRAHLAWLVARLGGRTAPDARAEVVRLCIESGDQGLVAASICLHSDQPTEVRTHQLEHAHSLLTNHTHTGIRSFVIFARAVHRMQAGEGGVVDAISLVRLLSEHLGQGLGTGLAVRACVGLSQSLGQSGRLEDAIRWSDRAIALAPPASVLRAMALCRRAALAVLEHDLDQAEMLVDAAFEWARREPRTSAALCMLLPHLGRTEEALQRLEASAAHFRTLPFLLRLYTAHLWMHHGDLQRTAALVPQLDVDSDPCKHDAVVLLTHATAEQTRVGDLERAVRRIRMDPDLLSMLDHALARRSDPWDVGSMRIRRAHFETARLLGRTAWVDPPAGRAVPLGAYDVDGTIGFGSNGLVLSGQQHETGEPVAVKLLHTPTIDDELRNEARWVGRLRHPHIVGVLDVGTVDAFTGRCGDTLIEGTTYVVMEVVTGGTLEPLCGTLTWDRIEPLLRQMLAAMAHAHARSTLHLDLKPANVLIQGTGPHQVIKLADFGVASILASLGSEQRRIAGTPSFMAPEQWSACLEDLGPWTDLYQFGCLAWMLLTGQPLFSGIFSQIRDAHLFADRPGLDVPFEVPESLEGWLHRLLAPHRSDRFQSAAQASAALVGSATTKTCASSVPPVPQPGVARLCLEDGPLIGWETQQDALLAQLGAAESEQRVVQLCPPPGGTSALLDSWLIRMVRERGLPAHRVDIDAKDWELMLLRSCAECTGLPGRDLKAMLRARFPGLSQRRRNNALDVLRADLTRGTGVVVVLGDAELVLNALAGVRCLVVVRQQHPAVSQRFSVPRHTPKNLADLLRTRLPVVPELALKLALSAGGHADIAVSLLARLIDEDALVPSGSEWRLAPHATLPDPAPRHPTNVMSRFLDQSDDCLIVACAAVTNCLLTDVRLRGMRGDPARAEADLHGLGLLDTEGLVIPSAVDAVVAWIDKQGRETWEIASSLDSTPVHAARILRLLGHSELALVELLDAAEGSVDRAETQGLLDRALSLVGSEPTLCLPARYHLIRGRWLMDHDPEAAQRYLNRAQRDGVDVSAELARQAAT